jgi:outer membrane protein OmpA-like peptidoglycan-associated protein
MVAGRADIDGKMGKNNKLAYKRAAVAANYLHGCGVDEARFFVDSYGEEYPDYRNNSKLNKERNRRVDFLIIPSNVMREEVTNY